MKLTLTITAEEVKEHASKFTIFQSLTPSDFTYEIDEDDGSWKLPQMLTAPDTAEILGFSASQMANSVLFETERAENLRRYVNAWKLSKAQKDEILRSAENSDACALEFTRCLGTIQKAQARLRLYNQKFLEDNCCFFLN